MFHFRLQSVLDVRERMARLKQKEFAEVLARHQLLEDEIVRNVTALARATRGCPDFDELIRRQAVELIKANLLFQRLVVSNMRDQDPGVVADLYGSQYREIFKNDIR